MLLRRIHCVIALLSLPGMVACTNQFPAAMPAAASSTVAAQPGPTPTPFRDGCKELGYRCDAVNVTGTIKDPDGNRLGGVTVMATLAGGQTFVNGSDTFAAYSQVGAYAINGAPPDATVTIKLQKAGYADQSANLAIPAQGRSDLNFTLSPTPAGSDAQPSPKP